MRIDKDLVPIDVEYAYLTIPADYICTYHKLVMLISEFGKDIIDDCTYACKDKGKNISNCWNLFQSAVASFNIGERKQADFYINYIEQQLKLITKNDNRVYPTTIPISITPDGKLKAIVSCCSDQQFLVDVETGKMYHAYQNGETCKGEYKVLDNNLTFNKYGQTI